MHARATCFFVCILLGIPLGMRLGIPPGILAGTASAAPLAAELPTVEPSSTIAVPPAHDGAPTPAGLELLPATAAEILAVARSTNAKAVIVNLWATWCTPCREEFPDLMRFSQAYKDRGVALLLVSGDFPSEHDAAKHFLSSQGVDFRSYLKSGKDDEFINTFDIAWSGALPATFLYDAKGSRKHSFLGPVTYDTLEQAVAPMLATTP